MGRDELPPIEDSREGGRVLLLVIVFAALMLTLVSLATSRSISASADLFSRSQAPPG
jgi:hypothetical protein